MDCINYCELPIFPVAQPKRDGARFTIPTTPCGHTEHLPPSSQEGALPVTLFREEGHTYPADTLIADIPREAMTIDIAVSGVPKGCDVRGIQLYHNVKGVDRPLAAYLGLSAHVTRDVIARAHGMITVYVLGFGPHDDCPVLVTWIAHSRDV